LIKESKGFITLKMLIGRELQNLQYAGYFFSNAVREAEENQVCAMCKRGFGEHELDAFKDTVSSPSWLLSLSRFNIGLSRLQNLKPN